MQGRILGYDPEARHWQIAGSDGQRYDLVPDDWKLATAPEAGQAIDFQPVDGRATSVFAVATTGAGAGGGGVTTPGEKNRVTAALFAFFLGGLGIHKFYLGKSTAGIIMLLCSLFGIILLFLPTIVIGVIAFVEFIIYLTMSDADFERTYVKGDKAWF